jgi:Family of unknown function (DUF5675)
VKRLLLERLPTTADHTEGFLSWAGEVVCTIERPWIEDPDGNLGGKPNESCVPAGVYELRPYTRSRDGKHVVALVNEKLGVYFSKADMLAAGKGGRFKILIHIANWVKDIIGCIGPGIYKADTSLSSGRMVAKSTDAMKLIMAYVEKYDLDEIEIRWIV